MTMRPLTRNLLLSLALSASALPTAGCATVLGTAFSPVTGGVDLVRRTQTVDTWHLWLPVFLGGAVAGPFLAIYNGVNHDATVFTSWHSYWVRFDEVFRPFEMIGL